MQRIGANFQNALKESSFRGVMFLPVCLLNTSILSYLKVCVPSAGSDWLFLNFHHLLGLGIVFVDEVVS